MHERIGVDKVHYTSRIRTGRLSKSPLEIDQETPKGMQRNTETGPTGLPKLITLAQGKHISLLYKIEE